MSEGSVSEQTPEQSNPEYNQESLPGMEEFQSEVFGAQQENSGIVHAPGLAIRGLASRIRSSLRTSPGLEPDRSTIREPVEESDQPLLFNPDTMLPNPIAEVATKIPTTVHKRETTTYMGVEINQRGDLFNKENSPIFRFEDKSVYPNFPNEERTGKFYREDDSEDGSFVYKTVPDTRPVLVRPKTGMAREVARADQLELSRANREEQRKNKEKGRRNDEPLKSLSIDARYTDFFSEPIIEIIDRQIYGQMADELRSLPAGDELSVAEKRAIRWEVAEKALPIDTPDEVIEAFLDAHNKWAVEKGHIQKKSNQKVSK